jgi:exopolysaccharide biosynthesis polyprenyl glycosylphosphotransferase
MFSLFGSAGETTWSGFIADPWIRGRHMERRTARSRTSALTHQRPTVTVAAAAVVPPVAPVTPPAAQASARRSAAPPADPAAWPGPTRTAGSGWRARYRIALVGIDVLAAALASTVVFVTGLGSAATGSVEAPRHVQLVIAVLLPLAWVVCLIGNRAYDANVLGAGAEEFHRIGRSFVLLTATLAFVSYAAEAQFARSFVLVVLPFALVLDLLLRYVARKILHRLRRHGAALSRVIVIGRAEQALDLVLATRRDVHGGLAVIGVCLPSAPEGDFGSHDAAMAKLAQLGVTVEGELDDVLDLVARFDADALAVAGSAELGPAKLRWISWQLEGSGVDLIVSPGLMDVAGTRLHVRPLLDNLPLLQVEAPCFRGFRRLVKSGFDRGVAALALIALSPLFLLIAVVIRLTSRGPAFFRQARVGRDGSTFVILKFRSMYVGAEAQLPVLAAHNEVADGPLFKIRTDPRVTPIGRWLRRLSIDELPQLLNVLHGAMSLVGPRPPLPSEVADYDDHVRRRLLVKPGITGLWQVSGRSDLSWQESVGLDLRYVENWSLATDLFILWKTARVVISGLGAY